MKNLAKILECLVLLGVTVLAADSEDRELVYQENPAYPAIAAEMNLHGTVKLKIGINPDGTVRRLEYIGGHPLLAQAALKAVKVWKYEPGFEETTAQVKLKF